AANAAGLGTCRPVDPAGAPRRGKTTRNPVPASGRTSSRSSASAMTRASSAMRNTSERVNGSDASESGEGDEEGPSRRSRVSRPCGGGGHKDGGMVAPTSVGSLLFGVAFAFVASALYCAGLALQAADARAVSALHFLRISLI